MPMRWLIVETFQRLEQFILPCEAYEGTVVDKVAVFSSYAAWYTYIFLLVQTFYDRSMFHVVLWMGIFVNGMAIWAADNYLLKHNEADAASLLAACAQHTEPMISPEAGVILFVVSFFLVWDIYTGGNALWHDGLSFLWFVLFTLLGTGSLYVIHLYRISEIIMGGAVGAVVGCVFALLAALVLLPRWDTETMGKVKHFLNIKRKNFTGGHVWWHRRLDM